MMTIVDDLVSVDDLVEDYLTAEPANEYIQSCDIVAFNKICESMNNFLSICNSVRHLAFHRLIILLCVAESFEMCNFGRAFRG